jgi:mono/diheme cytochrome c family protein
MNSYARLLIALCVFAMCAVSVIAQQSAGSLTADPVYQKNCAKCHGKTAGGRHFGGPPLAKSKMSLEELKAIIANGKGRMPKYAGKLTDEQIATLAGEIKALSANQPQK